MRSVVFTAAVGLWLVILALFEILAGALFLGGNTLLGGAFAIGCSISLYRTVPPAVPAAMPPPAESSSTASAAGTGLAATSLREVA